MNLFNDCDRLAAFVDTLSGSAADVLNAYIEKAGEMLAKGEKGGGGGVAVWVGWHAWLCLAIVLLLLPHD